MEVPQAKGHRVLCYHGALHVSRGTAHTLWIDSMCGSCRAALLHQFLHFSSLACSEPLVGNA